MIEGVWRPLESTCEDIVAILAARRGDAAQLRSSLVLQSTSNDSMLQSIGDIAAA